MKGQAEPQGLELGKFLEGVLARLAVGVYVLDRQGRFLYANARLERLWRLRREQYVGRRVTELGFPAAHIAAFSASVDDVVVRRTAVQGSLVLGSQTGRKRHFDYLLSPILNANGDLELIAGAAHERGAGQRPETERSAEEHFRLLFNAIDQAFCLLEIEFDEWGDCQDFRLLQANPAFARHTGLANALGRKQTELLPDLEEKWRAAWCRVARSGIAEHFVEKSLTLGRWYDTSVLPVEGPGGRQVALLFYDITQRKLIEEGLQEADRRKDEFLATLAHELRNPLAAISTSVDLVKLARNEPALVQEAFETIERQARQLAVLVDDLLEVSRISRGKLELRKTRVSLAEILQIAVECSQPLIRAAGHTLILNLPQEPVFLNADPHRLSQVFANLLNNAAKFTPDKGRIRLSARVYGEQVEISVQDSGIGIAPELREQIFELFAQVKRPLANGNAGLGLGLSLARSLVELHGGCIAAHSSGPGRGSTFTVRLPLGDQRRDGLLAPQEAHPQVEGSYRVLVVDDNHAAARMLTMVLRLLGHEAWTAGDGEEAVALAAKLQPDAIFMDLGMPRMDGFEAVRHIRALPCGQRIVIAALSGWGQTEDHARSRQAGFDFHLVKPAGKAELEGVLAQVRHFTAGSGPPPRPPRPHPHANDPGP